jgi:hypothetical protein
MVAGSGGGVAGMEDIFIKRKKTEIRFWQKGRMTSMEEMEMNIILNIANQIHTGWR